MSNTELESSVKELRELRRMADELAAEIETIQSNLRSHMDHEGLEVISGTDWRLTYKTITTTRLDSAALRRECPELARRFTKTTAARRFCVV